MNKSEHSTSSTNVSVGATSRGVVLVVVESFIFLLLDLAALVGNALVCLALYRNISLRTVTNNFILSLALTDLLMAILVMPLKTCASLADEWIGGTFGLELYGYSGHILGATSLVTVALVAINRYFRVVRPTLYSKIYSKKSSTIMAVSAWIVSAVIFIVGFPVFGVHFQPYTANPTILSPKFPSAGAFTFYVAIHSVFISVGGFIIITCYVKIYQTIRHHNTAAAQLSEERRSSYGVEEAKITRILTVVLIGFYICWLPPFIAGFLDSFKFIGEGAFKYQNFYYSFPAHVSNVINPLIYARMSGQYRAEFLKILRGHCFT